MIKSLLAFDVPESLSLDAWLARGRGLWEFARSDPAGFAFWTVVWIGSFAATFLFLRMLLTRWGDSNVTRKTMSLSLLFHLVVAIASTRWDLPQGGAATGQEQVIHFHRRNLVDDATIADRARERADDQSAPNDKRSVFDEPPRFAEAQSARLPRESPDGTLPEKVPEPRADDAPREVSAAALPPEPATVAAEPAREPDRPAAHPAAISTPLVEETAAVRADAALAGAVAQRAARPAAPAQPAALERHSAPENEPTAALPADARSTRAVESADPQATRRRPIDSDEARRNSAPQPAAAAVSEAESSPADADTATRALATKSTARLPRPGSTAGEAPAAERLREAAPAVGALSSDRLLAARSAAGGALPEGMAPRALRAGGGAVEQNSGQVPAPYRLRGLPQRKKFALDMGASEASERAVEASLQWLARHQHTHGYWSPIESTLGREPDDDLPLELTAQQRAERERAGFQTESAMTALALLAFLGANYTHEDNVFADNVARGLNWLVSQQERDGFLGGRANRYARMYCHGMATIALGEAYGMTKDTALREPLARAVAYIVDCQNPQDGGWRYLKGYRGDMSMFGWQLMALKSARTAGLDVPDETFDRAIDFLLAHGRAQRQRKQSRYGGLAGYRISADRTGTETAEPPKPSMTAEALFCKQMLGIDRQHASYNEAVEYLLQNIPRRSRQNLYYWYYGTLAMYQHGGEPWRRWNEALRDTLVADQRTDGDFAGSWNPRAPWGDFGGRVFSTALSALCLEVYYRFLPLYQFGDRFDPPAEKSAGK